MTTVASGRVICAKCGANNFETQAACWKCGVALAGGAAPVAVDVPNHRGGIAAPVARVVDNVDPSVAHWVGVIGGLLVPFAMLPVGLLLMMWDERRKVEVGRTATIASVVGTLLHGIFTYFAVYGAVQTGIKMYQGATGRTPTAQTQSAPDWNSEAKPLNLSGIPPAVPAK